LRSTSFEERPSGLEGVLTKILFFLQAKRSSSEALLKPIGLFVF